MIQRTRPSGAVVHQANNAITVIINACVLGDADAWAKGFRMFVDALRGAPIPESDSDPEKR
jgi:hypothetical protein